jgi:cytidylate kinase
MIVLNGPPGCGKSTLAQMPFLEQAEQVAEQAGASFHEIVLLAGCLVAGYGEAAWPERRLHRGRPQPAALGRRR